MREPHLVRTWGTTGHVSILLCILFPLIFPLALYAQEPSYVTPDGVRVDFEAARRAHREVLFGAPAHPGRVAIEQSITLILGSGWYWTYKAANSTDWDLEPTWSNFGRRFSDPSVVRFDTNRFFVNQGHILAGSVHYAIPRNNNFGVFASLGVGILTSAMWEWIFEYREYVSINDLITSPYGGQPLGEVTFKLGELHARQRSSLSLPARWLTFPFAQGRSIHAALGDEEPEFPDEFGPAMSHEFRADIGLAASGATADEVDDVAAAIRLETSVVDLPGYLAPGTFGTFFRDGNFSRLRIDVVVGDAPNWKRFNATARAELFGYYAQDISPDGGWAAKIGLGRGTWVDVRQQAELDDRLGVVDVIGPNASLHLLLGRARLAAGGGVYADFASVNSPAFEARSSEFSPRTLRTELQEQGYYFGWGVTAAPWVRWQFGRIDARAQLDASWFEGLRGPDRVHQNAVPRPVRLRDRRVLFSTEARVRVVDPVDIALRFERLRRSSELDETSVVRTVDELGLSVGAHF